MFQKKKWVFIYFSVGKKEKKNSGKCANGLRCKGVNSGFTWDSQVVILFYMFGCMCLGCFYVRTFVNSVVLRHKLHKRGVEFSFLCTRLLFTAKFYPFHFTARPLTIICVTIFNNKDAYCFIFLFRKYSGGSDFFFFIILKNLFFFLHFSIAINFFFF